MPLKSLGRSKYTRAATDTASKMRRTIMINPSTPPIVSAPELESLWISHDIVGISLSGVVYILSVQTPLAAYEPYTAETQHSYEVEVRRPNCSPILKVVLFTDDPM